MEPSLTVDVEEIKEEPPDMEGPSAPMAEDPIAGEYITSQELLRQHMTSPAIDSIINVAKGKKRKAVSRRVDYENFRCGQCRKEFTSKELLTAHFKTHAAGYPYRCDQCDRTFKVKKYVARHKARVHEGRRRCVCEHCGKGFFNTYQLKLHRYIHTGERPFECDVCGKSFNRGHVLAAHKLIHTDEKPYRCAFCDYGCRDASTLRKHEASHMGTAKQYACKICRKKYSTKYRLKMHVAEKHLGLEVRKFECDECSSKFQNRQCILKHILAVHRQEKPFKCDLCDRKFSARHSMQMHMTSHIQDKPFKCTEAGCEKRYKTKGDMVKHSRLHNPKLQYPCPTCRRLFTRKCRMLAHTLQHKVKEKLSPCPHCGVRFYNDSYVQNHIKMKHRERQYYQCDYCGFRVLNKPGLVVHIRHIHLKKKKYKCDVCNMKFLNLTPMRMHMWKEHSIRCKWQLKNNKAEQDSVEIKEEAIEIDNNDLEDVLRSMERMEEERAMQSLTAKDLNTLMYSGDVLSEDLARSIITANSHRLGQVPEKIFDSFYVKNVMEVTRSYIDSNTSRRISNHRSKKPGPEALVEAKLCLNELLERVRRRIQSKAVERAREMQRGGCDRPRRSVKTVDYSNLYDDIDFNDGAADTLVLYPKKNKVQKLLRINKNERIKKDLSKSENIKQYTSNKVEESDDIIDKREITYEDLSKNDNNNKYTNDKVDESNDIINERERTNEDLSKSENNKQHTSDKVEESDNIINKIERTNVDLSKSDHNNKYISNTVEESNNNIIKRKRTKDLSKSHHNNKCTSDKIEESDGTIDKKERTNEDLSKSHHNNKYTSDTEESNNKINKRKRSNRHLSKSEHNNKFKRDKVNESDNNNIIDAVSDNNDTTEADDNTEVVDRDDDNDKCNEDTANGDNVKDGVFDGIVIENVQEKYGKYYKVKFNMVQCYVCFKLYETREELVKHCTEHFPVNSKRHINKCAFCPFQSNGYGRHNLFRHMKNLHNIHLNNKSTKIDVRKDSNETKFTVKLVNKARNRDEQTKRDKLINKYHLKEIEVIPTAANMNRQVSMEIDRKRRERNVNVVHKRKLVRKGNEWIVEKVPVHVKVSDIKEIIGDVEASVTNRKEDLTVDPYIDRLMKMSRIAKKEGREMLFPCDRCSKVCQALCGLKTHRRLHNTKAKPYKPKIWKHKLTEETTLKLKDREKTKTVVKVIDNAKPQPITGRHRCDEKLKKFYEEFIRGSNIEFWQFLKIYNKIDKDDVTDFDAVEKFTRRADEVVERPDTSVNILPERRKRSPRNVVKYVRYIRVSRELHVQRLAKTAEMRKRITDDT